MDVEHTGDLMFLTFPSAVFVDPAWDRSTNYSIALADCSVLVSPFRRSRPIGWISRPTIARENVAAFDPNPAKFEIFVSSLAMLAGVDGHGRVLMFLDDEANFDRLGQFSADTLCVRVVGDPPDGDREQFSERLLEDLMRHIRIETGQWWAGRREVPATPAIQTTFEMAREDFYNGRIHSRSPGIFIHDPVVKAVNHEIFLKGLSAFKNAKAPDPDKAALSDVIFYYAQGDFLLCLLLACNAVERLRDDIYAAIGARAKDTDLLKHLSSRLETIAGRNLKTERPDLFTFAEDLWTARGNMAHGLPFMWKSDRSLTRPPENFTLMFQHLLEWLGSIMLPDRSFLE